MVDDTFTSIDDGDGSSKVQNSLKVGGTKYTTETQFRYCRSITSTSRSIGQSTCSLPFQVDVLTKKHFGKKFFCEANNGAAAAWANVTVEMRRKLLIFHCWI